MVKFYLFLCSTILSAGALAQPKIRFSDQALSVTANDYFAAVATKDSFYVYRLPEMQLYKKMKHNLVYPTLRGFATSSYDKPDMNDVLIVQENNFKPADPSLQLSLWAQLDRYRKSAYGERVHDSISLWSISKAAVINNKVPGNIHFDYFTFREMGVYGMNYISNAFLSTTGDSVFISKRATVYSKWDTDKSKQTEINKIIKDLHTCPVNLSFALVLQDPASKKYRVAIKNIETHQSIYESAETDEEPKQLTYTPDGQKITYTLSPAYNQSFICIVDIAAKRALEPVAVNDEVTSLQFVNYDSAIGYSTSSNWVQWNIADARIEKQISGTAFFSGFKLLSAISVDKYLLVHTQAMSNQGGALMQSELQLSATGDFNVFAEVKKGGEETIALQDGFTMQLNDLPDNFFDMTFNSTKTHFTILGNNDKRLQVWETRSRKKIMDKFFDNKVHGFIDESGRYVWLMEFKDGDASRYRLRHIDLKTGKMRSTDQLVASADEFNNNASGYPTGHSVPGQANAWYVTDGSSTIWKFTGSDPTPEKYRFTIPGFVVLRNFAVDETGMIYANIFNEKRERTIVAIDYNKKAVKIIAEGDLVTTKIYKGGILAEAGQGIDFIKDGKVEKHWPLEGKVIRMSIDKKNSRIVVQVMKADGEDGIYGIGEDGSILYQKLPERMMGMDILPNGQIVYINEAVKTFIDEKVPPVTWNAALSKDLNDEEVSVSENGRYIFKNHLIVDLKEANRIPTDPFIQAVFVPGKSENERIEIFSKGWNTDRFFTLRRISGADTTVSSQVEKVPDNAVMGFEHNRLVLSPDKQWLISYATFTMNEESRARPMVWNVKTMKGYRLPENFKEEIPFFSQDSNRLFAKSDTKFDEQTLTDFFVLNEFRLDTVKGPVFVQKTKKQSELNLPGEYNFELPEFTSIDWKLPNSSKNRKQFFSPQNMYCYAFSKAHQMLFGGTAEGVLHIWDINGSSSPVQSVQVTNNQVSRILVKGDKLYAFSASSNVAVYDIKEKKLLANLQYIQKEGEQRLAMYTPDNYFNLDPEAMDALHFTREGHVYPLSSYELQGNRPDKVFKAIGFAEDVYIETLNKSWQTRLKRVGVKPSETFLQNKAPGLEWERDDLPIIQKEKAFTLSFTATDSMHTPITKLLVRVNGVPFRGREGISIKIPDDTIRFKEIVNLNQGKNIISVIAINKNGGESVEQTHEIYYLPEQKQKTKIVYIGVGVSQYKDQAKNLVYAAKDVNDIAARIKYFADTVETHTLTDANATRQRILEIKNLLKKTSEDDVVILSFSGHGMIDTAAGFVFAPHDMNFDVPAQYGVTMTMIEDLLDDIPARKRLLLMDACHSGEQLEGLSANAKLPEGVKEVGTKGTEKIQKKTDKEKDSDRKGYMAMKELFGDFSRGNGAFMISAAASNEFALESRQWNNGVFTASFLEALYEVKEKSSDKTIKVRELRKAIYEKVKLRTKGQQTPTSRQENGWWNWSF